MIAERRTGAEVEASGSTVGWITCVSLLSSSLAKCDKALQHDAATSSNMEVSRDVVQHQSILSVSHSPIRALSPRWDSKGVRLPHLARSKLPRIRPVALRAHLTTESQIVSTFVFIAPRSDLRRSKSRPLHLESFVRRDCCLHTPESRSCHSQPAGFGGVLPQPHRGCKPARSERRDLANSCVVNRLQQSRETQSAD